MFSNPFPNPLVIPSGITANVGDPDFKQRTFKFQIQRKFLPCFRPINVSINCSQGFKAFKGVGHREVANIPRVPHFIGP